MGSAALRRALAAEGARVAFVYHSQQQAADELAAQLSEQGHEVRALQADVTDNARADAVVAQLLDVWQRIDILVNSAGVIRDGLFATMDPPQWHQVIDTNLTGTYNYCHAVVRTMMSQAQWQHHQHFQRGRRIRLAWAGELRRQQRGHRRAHSHAGQRAGRARCGSMPSRPA